MTEVGHMSRLNVSSIVFKPGPRAEFRVLTESLGCPGQFFFFKKSKRRCFSIKKKSTRCNQFFDRILSGHIRFFLPLFFLQPAPVSAPDRPVGPGFKTMVSRLNFLQTVNVTHFSYCCRWTHLVRIFPTLSVVLSSEFQCVSKIFFIFLFFFSHLSSLLHMSHVTFLNCIIFLDIFYCVILFI
jgi:hypothetical protein